MHTSNSPSFSAFLQTSRTSTPLYPFQIQTQPRKLKSKKPPKFPSFNCIQTPADKPVPTSSRNSLSSFSCSAVTEPPPAKALTVAEKVQCLSSEFRSLTEPIDRVKRLLDYATLLPPFEEAEKVQENRVMGCTAQVWLEAKMEINGLMRFRVDSDSEITKGFCSCLIWLLDNAAPEEVLWVKIDDLFEMNVGLPSRGNSRVNTWHNVLISMQKRTKDLIDERDRQWALKNFFLIGP